MFSKKFRENEIEKIQMIFSISIEPEDSSGNDSFPTGWNTITKIGKDVHSLT